MPDLHRQSYSYRGDASVPDFPDNKPLFVFDGFCVLCSTGVRWLMRNDRRCLVNFASAQSALGRALFDHYGVDSDETYLLVDSGRAFSKSSGYLRLCEVLGGLWRVFRVAALLPESWRDHAYDIVARNRYHWFGKVGQCELLPDDLRQRLLQIDEQRTI